MGGRNPGAYSQAVRLLKLLDDLRARSHGALLSELSREYEVTERQIRRDLAAIEDAGYDLKWCHDERRSRVGLEGGGAKFTLSLRQRYALLAARRVFDVLGGTPLQEDIETIYKVIASSLPPREKENLEQIRDRFVYLPNWGVKSYARRGDVMDGLLTGTLRRWGVSCRYSLPDGFTFDGLLHPYAMVLYKHGLYVVGASMRPAKSDPPRLEPQAPKVYAVERFSRAKYDKTDPFEVPADFDPERLFDGVFGIFVGGESQHVVVDFAADVRYLVEARRWHPTQKLTFRKNGSVRLEMDVSNIAEVVSWLMSWGPLARVRGPDELVRRIATEHRAAARYYSATVR
jgi:predicted DNA-binding transcriptional regulator YafY